MKIYYYSFFFLPDIDWQSNYFFADVLTNKFQMYQFLVSLICKIHYECNNLCTLASLNDIMLKYMK